MSQVSKLCSSLLLVLVLSLALAACQQGGPGVAEREAERVAATATSMGVPAEDVQATASAVVERIQTEVAEATPVPTATIGE